MPSKNFLVGLDIGSHKTRAMAIYSDEKEVISKTSEPTFGVRKGVVVDPDTVSKIVTSVLEGIEEQTGEVVNEVQVSLGGSHVFSVVSEGTVAVSRADQVISEEDVRRAVDAAQTFSLKKNREILEVFPKEFTVDKESGVREPVGMKGVRLEAEIVVLAYFSPYLDNLVRAVEKAGFKPNIVAGPLASAKSVLTPREKELGVLLLDIGSGTTSYTLFKERILLKTGVVPVGSGHITKDIAVGLKTDVDTAEKIKVQYGSCNLGGRKKIEVKENRTGDEISFSQAKLGRIIDARVGEILDVIDEEVGDTGDLPGGLVLTGGGSKLKGMRNVAKEQLGLAVRMGKPKGFFPSQEDASLSTLCGLVMEKGGMVDKGRWMKKFKRALKELVP